jgi:hypothetical protein
MLHAQLTQLPLHYHMHVRVTSVVDSDQAAVPATLDHIRYAFTFSLYPYSILGSGGPKFPLILQHIYTGTDQGDSINHQ